LAEAAQHRRVLHQTLADTLGTPVAARALAHVAAQSHSRAAGAEAV
jgi:hypothetical protein